VALNRARSPFPTHIMPSSPLPNYLRTNRKRLTLTQEELAFLLGFRGMSRGARVCRDEKFVREPNLWTALAYEAIYQKPIRELFAGLYERIEREVAGRAKLLNFRKDRGNKQQAAHRRQFLADLAARQSKQSVNSAPT
jgi:transcriptional regulator with XRE-family HTH domain